MTVFERLMDDNFYMGYHHNEDADINVWVLTKYTRADTHAMIMSGLMDGNENIIRYVEYKRYGNDISWRLEIQYDGENGFKTIDYVDGGMLCTSSIVHMFSRLIKDYIHNFSKRQDQSD